MFKKKTNGYVIMPEIPILKNLNVDVLDIENPPYERYIYLAKLKEKNNKYRN